MNCLIIDPRGVMTPSYIKYLPKEWKIDYNNLSSQTYDVVFIECDVCKLDDDISWSHWIRQDDNGFPQKDHMNDMYLIKKTWGSSDRYASIYVNIYSILKNINIKKIVMIDFNDRPIVSSGLKWLDKNGFPVDYVLKREYRKTHTWDYDDRVIPFPFMTFDMKACNVLYDTQTIDYGNHTEKHGCIFMGDPIYRLECGMRDEWTNRFDMLKILEKFGCIDWKKSKVPFDEYLGLYKKYRSFLHLNGTGHLCNRFFEAMGRGCLCVMQENDVVFPFGETPIHPSLIFYIPEQANEIINKLNTDDNYYKECLEYQKESIKRWFNKEHISNYIKQKIVTD